MKICDLCGGREGGVRTCRIDLGRFTLATGEECLGEGEGLDLCVECREAIGNVVDAMMKELQESGTNVRP